MNLKPIFVLIIILSLIMWLSQCEYGAEHQDVDPKYKNAHITAVSAQKLMKEKQFEEALRYYELARQEMEHPNVQANQGTDVYINYGFVMNDIGVIHLGWALYGKKLDTERSHIDPASIDSAELQTALQSFETAIDFYQRWFGHNPKDYERYSNAIAESYANYGTALKYADRQDEAIEAYRLALLRNPENGTALRGFELLQLPSEPHVEAGKAERERYKKLPL
ncbi:tetratricopeptide repeat protein [Desulfuromonas thiophila]|uniref:tetratricopeptide repeat protein n=1 Tax=Desulfuromonas thiophila TaxID=57664 RepID=UPI0029F46383|nr:tetratricopeptide repeat protein [Desulfuromonas thiophila]